MFELTDEERKIAEENHNLIYFFINHLKVDIEEYYDLFALDYIKCIKIFDENKGTLSTLLSKAFLNRVRIEQQKKNTLKGMIERKTLSLNRVICKERDLCLEDVIPDMKVNLEILMELKEDIEFFSKYDETRLLMQGLSIQEIATKLNETQKFVSKKIKDAKEEYKREELKEILKGGGSRWINQKGKRVNFICENGQKVL